MADTRITREAVIATIYAPAHRRRVVWSPSTTLAAMEIERYPHVPQLNYRKMKKLLKELCDAGLLIRRSRLHSHFTLKETAYERVGHDHPGVGGAV